MPTYKIKAINFISDKDDGVYQFVTDCLVEPRKEDVCLNVC